MNSLYHAHILSHYHNPKNYGLRGGFDIEIKGENPFCGDSLAVQLKFNEDTIIDVAFVTESCVIARAAASLCSEYIKGKTRDEVWMVPPEKVTELLQIQPTPSRMKCATLFLDTIRKAV